MLGLGAIEIDAATFSLGMCGYVIVLINATGRRHKVTLWMSEGFYVSTLEPGSSEWTPSRPMKLDEFIALLPEGRGWTEQTFIAAWAGFAAGYEKGRNVALCGE